MPTPLSRNGVYTRTAAAHAELQAPQRGLSVTQRRILALLDQPRSFGDIASAMHGDDARAERDVARLVELGFIQGVSQGVATPDATPPRIAPAYIAQPMRHAALPTRSPAPRVALGVLGVGVIGIAVAIAWPSSDDAATGGNATVAATAAIGTVTPAPPVPQSSATTTNVTPISTASVGAEAEPPPAARVQEPVRSVQPPQVAPVRNERTEQRAATRSETQAPAASTGHAATVAGTSVATSSVPGSNVPAASVPGANVGIAAEPAGASTVAAPAQATPGTVPAATPVIAVDAVPARQPPPAAPGPAPVLIAKAPATTLPAATKPRLAPTVREEPEFPREALLSRITSGRVVARLTVDKDGHVANVEIVSSEPRRVFDRAVNRALTRWRFEPSSETRSTEVEVDFRAN